jgi:hypothetical protein
MESSDDIDHSAAAAAREITNLDAALIGAAPQRGSPGYRVPR